VVLVPHEPAVEAVPEQVAGALMTVVEALRVEAVQTVEAGGQARPERLDDKVVVRSHEAEGMAAPGETIYAVAKQAEEEHAVDVVPEDGATVYSPGCDVVDTVGKIAAKRSRHARKLAAL
jgi:hypothetical protein